MPDNHPIYRLGKAAYRHDPRTLRLANYLTPDLPDPPPSLTQSDRVPSWPMYANDRLSDCTIAAQAHMVQLWTALAGLRVTPDEQQVVDTYMRLSGGVDSGLVELDVLRDWRSNGLNGETLLGFAAVDSQDTRRIRQAMALAGGVYCGAELPIAWQQATQATQDNIAWDVDPNGSTDGPWAIGSWGGHAYNAVDYDQRGIRVVTWGRLVLLTWAAAVRYQSEVWAAIPSSWRTTPPAGVDVDKLLADLAVFSPPVSVQSV